MTRKIIAGIFIFLNGALSAGITIAQELQDVLPTSLELRDVQVTDSLGGNCGFINKVEYGISSALLFGPVVTTSANNETVSLQCRVTAKMKMHTVNKEFNSFISSPNASILTNGSSNATIKYKVWVGGKPLFEHLVNKPSVLSTQYFDRLLTPTNIQCTATEPNGQDYEDDLVIDLDFNAKHGSNKRTDTASIEFDSIDFAALPYECGKDEPWSPCPPRAYEAVNDLPIDIPDNDVTGTSASVEIISTGKVAKLHVNAFISHPFRGDLIATLISPSGKRFVLINRKGAGADNLTIDQDVPAALQESMRGDWTLQIQDTNPRDAGKLEKFSITTTPFCD
jgi:hypothetical protein